MSGRFDLQGHRGARGRKPENTLPSFEAALDAGVSSLETDLHLTADGVPVLVHDPIVTDAIFRLQPGSRSPPPSARPLVRGLTLEQLRGYRADRNPNPGRFPEQEGSVTPLARLAAEERGRDPYAPPTVVDLFDFVAAYAGEPGARIGKTDTQRQRALLVRFDLELKRVPFYPHVIGDGFDGAAPALFEERLVKHIREAGVVERTAVRSFDHRSVKALRRLEPRLTAGILIAETAPVAPAELVRQADAQAYCPSFQYLDEPQVRLLQAQGIRVLPWTANEPDEWNRLLDWGVDGITTDYPDRLAVLLTARGIAY